MFRSATYYISGSPLSNVTNGADSFFTTYFFSSLSLKRSKHLSITFTDAKMTAGLLWASLGRIRSIIFSASFGCLTSYIATASKI